MPVSAITLTTVQPLLLPPGGQEKQEKAPPENLSFAQILAQQLDQVNIAQIKADETTKQFLAGNIQDVHQVMIAAQEAKITLQLAVEIRNKIIEAYQEISRMPV